ncbi:hypothetical protein F444_16909 [Phytophthora nicotianae P1976]|uniref:Uncharacterized protein n=1 Tax=Phytophthora nicotianae P1976 TaxID=1317066 RepID=A0A080ZGQ8_PHYNI|nr:hypothetical protein F444_16909 [Phytophthora nicotianae P1976]
MDLLRELLKLNDSNDRDSAIIEASNLHRATQNGRYVWVHESEMERLEGKLTPCAKISLSIRNVRGLREFGRVNLHKNVYYKWEITYGSGTMCCRNGRTNNAIWNGDAGLLWTSPTVELDALDAADTLGKYKLKVSVNRARHFFCRVLDLYKINETTLFQINTIPILPPGMASLRFAVVAQIDILYPHKYSFKIMNLFKHYSTIVIIVLLFRVIRPGAATGSRVKTHEVNESPSCSARTITMHSTIIPAPCTVNAECVQESGPDSSNSLYNFCDCGQQTYLKDAYLDTTYVL